MNALTTTVPSDKVSRRYQFISSAQFIADMQSNGWTLQNTVNRSRTGFGKHAMRFRSIDPAFQLPSGDFLEIVVLNSHDGTTSFQLSLGIYRLVCSNGLVVGKNVVPPVFIRHVGYAAEKVKNALNTLLTQSVAVRQTVARLQVRELTSAEYFHFIEQALIARGLTPHSVNVEQFDIAKREEDKANTAWAVLNRIQEYSVQGFRYVDLASNEVKTARKLTAAKTQIDVNKRLFDAIVQIAA